MPDWLDIPVWLIAFAIAFPVGTFVEYWGHRLMHNWLLKKRHAEHHRDGWGQGWIGEFWDYFIGTIYLLPLGFLYSVEAGIGFAGGAVFYAAFAAYAHQLQHEKPELCFWMRQPVHYIHHHYHMWKENFGISFSIWDHVFRTHKKVEWSKPPRGSWWGLFQIHWLGVADDESNAVKAGRGQKDAVAPVGQEKVVAAEAKQPDSSDGELVESRV